MTIAELQERLANAEKVYANAKALADAERDAAGISARYLELHIACVELFYDVSDAKFYLDRYLED